VSVGMADIDRVFVFWSPEACIADSLPDDGLAKVMTGSTQVNSGWGIMLTAIVKIYLPFFHKDGYKLSNKKFFEKVSIVYIVLKIRCHDET